MGCAWMDCRRVMSGWSGCGLGCDRTCGCGSHSRGHRGWVAGCGRDGWCLGRGGCGTTCGWMHCHWVVSGWSSCGFGCDWAARGGSKGRRCRDWMSRAWMGCRWMMSSWSSCRLGCKWAFGCGSHGRGCRCWVAGCGSSRWTSGRRG